jgi:hypothetical protein
MPREFRQLEQSVLSFREKSCFVGTDVGLAWARQLRIQAQQSLPGGFSSPLNSVGAQPMPEPHWDGQRLWFSGLLVKEYSKHAWAQIMILDAFQKLGWPPYIQNPFAGPKALDRLENAIKKLNQRHVHAQLLRFFLTRVGEGVGWKPWRTAAAPNRNLIGPGNWSPRAAQFGI